MVYVPPSEPISPGVLEPVYDKLSKFATTLSEALEKKIQLVPTDSDWFVKACIGLSQFKSQLQVTIVTFYPGAV